ncbi:unnamed protein product [Victoria cruziana]
MESEPLVVDSCSFGGGERCQYPPTGWSSYLIGDGARAVGGLPSCPPSKQKQSRSDEILMFYSLSSEQNCMSELASNSDDDCLILDGDPDKPNAIIENNCDGSDDLVVVGEKGKVACRDFPHPRHLCVKFPFNTSPHEKYCDLCHCYVCDTRAPCAYWGTGFSPGDHCHSSDGEEKWRSQRKAFKLPQILSITSSNSVETTLSGVSSPYGPGYPLSPSSSATMNSVPVQSPVSRTSGHGSSPSGNFVWHPTSITGYKCSNQSPLGNSKNQSEQFRRRNIEELTQEEPCAAQSRQQKQQNYCFSRFVNIFSKASATPTRTVESTCNYDQTISSITQKVSRSSLGPSEMFHLSRIEHFLLSDDDLNAEDSENLCLSGSNTHDWGILYSTCRNGNASNPSLPSYLTQECSLAGSSTRSGSCFSNTTRSASSFGLQFQTNIAEMQCQTPTGGMVDPPGSYSNWITGAASFSSLSSAPDCLNLDLPKTMDAVLYDRGNLRITNGVLESPIEATLNHRLAVSLLDPYAIGLIQEAHKSYLELNGLWKWD